MGIILWINPGYKTRGGRLVAKHNSYIRVAYPEAKFQIWDLVRVVGIIDPLPHIGGGGRYSGKIRLMTSRESVGT